MSSWPHTPCPWWIRATARICIKYIWSTDRRCREWFWWWIRTRGICRKRPVHFYTYRTAQIGRELPRIPRPALSPAPEWTESYACYVSWKSAPKSSRSIWPGRSTLVPVGNDSQLLSHTPPAWSSSWMTTAILSPLAQTLTILRKMGNSLLLSNTLVL